MTTRYSKALLFPAACLATGLICSIGTAAATSIPAPTSSIAVSSAFVADRPSGEQRPASRAFKVSATRSGKRSHAIAEDSDAGLGVANDT
jgi:hypothetical protein